MRKYEKIAYLEVIALNEDTVGGQEVTVFDLADVADHYVADADRYRFALPDHAERVLALDAGL